jgi:PAS domain S-box-containing protein
MKFETTISELRMILDACQDGIYVSDENLVGVYANRAFERISGIPLEFWVGNSLLELKDEGYITDIVSKRVLDQKQPVTMMQSFKNGNKAIVTGMPVFTDEGKINKVVTTAHNVTEINRLSEKLKQMNQLKEQYEQELNYLRKKAQINKSLITKNPKMEQIVEIIPRISEIDVPVLLLGESGVGKDVFANMIHKSSPRNKGPFIEVNCGAIPKDLIESELFGYSPGAFTGAKKEGKPGLFEMANTGTIFLDEIGDLPMNLQVKLLRVLQSLKVTRIGDHKTINLDVKIIAATNKNLKEMVANNEFREDLFYRLNVVPVQIPPLRDRKDDIPILAASFLHQFNEKYNKNKYFLPNFIDALENYQWPGNVRELKNLIERVVVLTESEGIDETELPYQFKKDFTKYVNKGNQPVRDMGSIHNQNQAELWSSIESQALLNSENPNLKDLVEELEKKVIIHFLTKEKTISKTADLLGMSQPTLSRKVKKYKIQQLFQFAID